MSLGVLLFIVAILVVVMVHEAGHFLVAKLFGFKATKFFVGFGPTVWSTTRGETEYGVKALPFGGFVKIVGMNPYEEVAPEDQHRAYPNKPRWQRALLLVAGSATHWVVAFVLLLFAATAIGYPTDQPTNVVEGLQETVGERPSPAVLAGFERGDEIVALDGRPTESWRDITAFIAAHPDETVTFTVERDGRRLELEAHLAIAVRDRSSGEFLQILPPGAARPEPPRGAEVVGFLGVGPRVRYEKLSLGAAVVDSGARVAELTRLSVKGIGDVFGMVFGGELFEALSGEGERRPDEGPLGLVGAGRIAGESVAAGRYLDLIGLVVGFTIFVGLMNLLPLPPLDGGHLAVLAYEAVTKRRIDLRKLIPIAAAVISFFVVLFLAVLYLDLARPITSPF